MDEKDNANREKPKAPRSPYELSEEPIRPLVQLMCGLNPREHIEELETWDIATAHKSKYSY